MSELSLARRIAAALVSRPPVYRLVQRLAGQARVAAQLRSSLPRGADAAATLDVGSAEGGFSARLAIDPVFVDIDARPLLAMRRSRPRARAAAANASALPFPDRAFDVSLCVAVSHHLEDGELDGVLAELRRVTRSHLVFLDALRNDGRALSRLLWRFDRGPHPRTKAELEAALGRKFRLGAPEEFTVYHQYVLWVASPL